MEKPLLDTTASYSDEFVDINQHGITIKWYYFPTATSKVIPWEHVKKWEVRLREDSSFVAELGEFKSWGMALSDVWWACDMCRFLDNRAQVVVTTGSWIRKGFSCRDPYTAVSLIAHYASKAALSCPYEEEEESKTDKVMVEEGER